MAGDPDLETTLNLLKLLPKNGVDIIELGMPFTDPIADGISIQRAGQRSLNSGTNLLKILNIIKEFRKTDNITPVVLMGYYNPIYSMGVENFLNKAKLVGVDGLLIVDLPPEGDNEVCLPAKKKGIDFIRLATPTSNDKRLKKIIKNSSGFLYYVSITGVTGNKLTSIKDIQSKVLEIKKKTDIPVCVGFGIKNNKIAKEIANFSDGVVVGSAIIERIEKKLSLEKIIKFCNELSIAIKNKNNL
tara:strand:- start:893 stop:1624 length:732 start_codon:yes stop_codon:yes gene_type:complete